MSWRHFDAAQNCAILSGKSRKVGIASVPPLACPRGNGATEVVCCRTWLVKMSNSATDDFEARLNPNAHCNVRRSLHCFTAPPRAVHVHRERIDGCGIEPAGPAGITPSGQWISPRSRRCVNVEPDSVGQVGRASLSFALVATGRRRSCPAKTFLPAARFKPGRTEKNQPRTRRS